MVKSAIKKIIDFGYEYSKDIYDNWVDYYVDENDEESYYKNSYDSDNHPYKDNLSEQIGDQSWHAFCSGELFENIELNGGEDTLMEKMGENLYDKFREGVELFLKEKYE